MITLLTDKKIQFPRNLTKISKYVAYMDEHRNFEGEPIPIKYYNERIFKIFEKWFKVLNEVLDYDVDDDNTRIFIQDFLKTSDVETFIELYKFGASNEISLLCNTVAYNMRNLNVVQNLIFDKQKQQILQIPTELSNSINEWKTKNYNNENNYRNLFVEYRKFNVYRKGLLVETKKEIPAKMFLILYKLWLNKGMNFVKTDDFKTLCQIFNFKIGVESINNSNNKMSFDYFEVIERVLAENGDKHLKNTFKEFIKTFRIAIFDLNDTEIEMMFNFLSNLI